MARFVGICHDQAVYETAYRELPAGVANAIEWWAMHDHMQAATLSQVTYLR